MADIKKLCKQAKREPRMFHRGKCQHERGRRTVKPAFACSLSNARRARPAIVARDAAASVECAAVDEFRQQVDAPRRSRAPCAPDASSRTPAVAVTTQHSKPCSPRPLHMDPSTPCVRLPTPFSSPEAYASTLAEFIFVSCKVLHFCAHRKSGPAGSPKSANTSIRSGSSPTCGSTSSSTASGIPCPPI